MMFLTITTKTNPKIILYCTSFRIFILNKAQLTRKKRLFLCFYSSNIKTGTCRKVLYRKRIGIQTKRTLIQLKLNGCTFLIPNIRLKETRNDSDKGLIQCSILSGALKSFFLNQRALLYLSCTMQSRFQNRMFHFTECTIVIFILRMKHLKNTIE